MKRTPLKRKSSLKTRTPLRGSKIAQVKRKAKKAPKSPQKGYKPPKWFNKIKPGSHGSTPAQKRLWRVVSETYREEDFVKFGPYCPCCGKGFTDWREMHLGHWLRYSLCNSWMKVERVNLAAICPGCNYLDDAITLQKLGEALKLRYGEDTLLFIEHKNLEMRGIKMETWAIVDYVARLRPDLVEN